MSSGQQSGPNGIGIPVERSRTFARSTGTSTSSELNIRKCPFVCVFVRALMGHGCAEFPDWSRYYYIVPLYYILYFNGTLFLRLPGLFFYEEDKSHFLIARRTHTAGIDPVGVKTTILHKIPPLSLTLLLRYRFRATLPINLANRTVCRRTLSKCFDLSQFPGKVPF